MLGKDQLSTILASEDWDAICDLFGIIFKIQEFGSLTDLRPIITPFPVLAERLAIKGFHTLYDLSVFLDNCLFAAGQLPLLQEPNAHYERRPIDYFPTLSSALPLNCRSCSKISARRCDQTQCRLCCQGCSYHPRRNWVSMTVLHVGHSCFSHFILIHEHQR